MSNKLKVVIMAHKKRKHLIPYLHEKLGKVPVIWDRKNNLWDTCRRAWLAYDPKYEYHCVIQDDALVTDNFYKKAEKFLTGDRVISFYLSRLISNRVKTAIDRGEDCVESSMIFNEVAICMPTKYIEEMVKYCDDHGAKNDQLIGQWARNRGCHKARQIYYPIPSLTSHRDEEPSIYKAVNNLPAPTRERKAIEFYEK